MILCRKDRIFVVSLTKKFNKMNETKSTVQHLKSLFDKDEIASKLRIMLGEKKMQVFITSVLQGVAGDEKLKIASPQSVFNAAMIAASLDLPINKSLGFAWMIPYKVGKTEIYEAQFQIGYKGYTQLALRTNAYRFINSVAIHENQFKSFDYLSEELVGDFTKEGTGKVVGYAAAFELIGGFRKLVYWTEQTARNHGQRYSKSFSRYDSVWQSEFDSMAKKSVLKNCLSKWGILSLEMHDALIYDQAVINSDNSFYYPDNEKEPLSQQMMIDKKPITPEIYDEAIESIKAGNTTADAINDLYLIDLESYEALKCYEPKGK